MRGREGAWRLAAAAGEATPGEVPAVLPEEVLAEVAEVAESMAVRMQKQLVSLKNQLKDPKEAEEWQNKGNSLQSMPRNKWRRGLTQVEVPDYSQLDENGMPLIMVVELDPDKDFQENSKLCFKQAKKIIRGREKVAPLVEKCQADEKRWWADAAKAARWKEELAASGKLSEAAAEGVLQLYSQMVDEQVIKPPPPPPPPPDPEEEARLAFKRKYGKDIDCFRSPNGHEVICGRASRTNEYVSLKLAKGDMVWFHTDNRIPGSHVLIKAPWDSVTDEDIEFAAKIAAWHSKAKNDLQAPVMYCRGHQVRKIKGTPLGMVSISGNTYQIMVKPGLPADEKEEKQEREEEGWS